MPLMVGTREFRLDLVFYHLELRCYVILELKTVRFEPEHVGKLTQSLPEELRASLPSVAEIEAELGACTTSRDTVDPDG